MKIIKELYNGHAFHGGWYTIKEREDGKYLVTHLSTHKIEFVRVYKTIQNAERGIARYCGCALSELSTR